MIKTKVVLSVIIFAALFAIDCSKNQDQNGSASNKLTKHCCDDILLRAKPLNQDIDKLLYICISIGGDVKKILYRDLTIEISNSKSKIITSTKLFMDTIIDGKQPLVLIVDTLEEKKVKLKNIQEVFTQNLFKFDCGKKYIKDENRTSIISVYHYQNGISKCYACSENEIIEHPEFEYFYKLLNESNLFTYNLKDIVANKIEIVDSLRNVYK